MEEETQTQQEEVKEEIIDVSPIEEAKKILEENKKFLEKITEERKKFEKVVSEGLINGRSYAGQKVEKKIEDPKDYARRIEKGVL